MNVVNEKLADCQREYKGAKAQLEFQKKLLAEKKDDRDKTNEKYSQFKSMEALKVDTYTFDLFESIVIVVSFFAQTEIKTLNAEASWLAVANQEALIAEIQKTKDTSSEQKEKILRTIANADNGHQELQDQMNAKKQEITSNARSATNFEAEYGEMREKFKEMNENFCRKARELKTKKSRKVRMNQELENLQQHLAERMRT